MNTIVTGGALLSAIDWLARWWPGDRVLVLDDLLDRPRQGIRPSSALPTGNAEFVGSVVERAHRLRATLQAAGVKRIERIIALLLADEPRSLRRSTGAGRHLGTMSLIEIACSAARFLLDRRVYGDPLVHPQPESYSDGV